MPYKFTAKELDEETGLYYYGARYLDPKYSMWISTDPALGDYIPKAPINEEAKKHNQNLPGMGGVFNHINGNLYHYAGNNPVKYTDPDGRENGTPYSLKLGIPYDAEKKLIDREYKAWLSQFSLSNRTERTITPFPEQNIKSHDTNRGQYKDPKLMLYHSVTDVGLIEVDATALRFGGEMDTKFFLGFYADIMDNHLHFYNNDEKKGIDYKFSLASFSLVAGVRGERKTLRMSISPTLGDSAKLYVGNEYGVGTPLGNIFNNIPILKIFDLEIYENE